MLTRTTAPSFFRQYVFGLRRSSDHHAPAYGFSIAAGVTLVVLTKREGTPSYLEIFLFIVGSAGAVAAISATATRAYRTDSPEQPQQVVALATSLSVISISAATGVVIGVCALFSGWSAWLVSGVAFAVVYLLLVALEFAIGTRAHPEGHDA